MARLSPTVHFPAKNHAPGLSIYLDKTGTISVSDTEITIEIDSIQYVIPYVGKTLEEIADQVSTSSGAFDAVALNETGQVAAGQLYIGGTGDTTPDGGQVVRFRGHIVRYGAETKIRAMLPYHENRLLPWYPRVSRGSLGITWNGVKYIFSVPEYQDQEWSPLFGMPYVDQVGVKADFIDSHTLKVQRTPLYWTRNNIGIMVDGVPIGASIVKDVDIHNGIIKLKTPLDRIDDIRVNYVYKEESLVYKDLNLNPSITHNPSIIDQTAVMYLRPYVWRGAQKRSRTVYHTVSKTISGAISAIDQGDTPVLVVGAYQVKPSGVVTDLSFTDTRSRGGGIKEDKFDAALRKNREVYSAADTGRYDGVPFPAAAAGILSLPRSILDTMSDEHIQKVVSRHLAIGGHILIDYSAGSVVGGGDFDPFIYILEDFT